MFSIRYTIHTLGYEWKTSREESVVEIQASKENGVAVIALHGRLDELSAPELEHTSKNYEGASQPRVLLDLSGVEYVSSGGLRAIIGFQKGVKKSGGALSLCGLNPFVAEVFEISRISPLFSVFPGRREALDALVSH